MEKVKLKARILKNEIAMEIRRENNISNGRAEAHGKKEMKGFFFLPLQVKIISRSLQTWKFLRRL